MKFIVDHDLHIHSNLSECSRDPNQTPEAILDYAKQYGLKTVCLTNHFWDEAVEFDSPWYAPQNYPHIAKAKPLPQAEGIRFLFGCETELSRFHTLGLSKEKYDLFDFIVIPTTHLHFVKYNVFAEDVADVPSRAKTWLKRLDAVLNMDLPFHKVGIAHLTCGLIARTKPDCLAVLDLLPEEELRRLFTKAAKLGVGIELNSGDLEIQLPNFEPQPGYMNYTEEELEHLLRIYRIAKDCGCKFYCASDAHEADDFVKAGRILQKIADMLELREDDKFIIP